MNFAFANLEVGKYAFLALIPLIILYLIRPKPRDVVIPSLMFIMKLTGKSKAAAFLRKIVSDPLFLVQLLLILIIACAAIEPIAKYVFDASVENTVIVLDSSASMQANSRFSHAIREAMAKLDGHISIVLAKNQPDIVLEDGSGREASRLLNILKPTSSTSNVGDAILVGEELLGDRKGKIVVISDFIDTNGADLNELKKYIENKGKIMEYIDVADKAENVGIVDLKYGREQSTVYIRNFNDKKVTVPVFFGKEQRQITLLPNSIETAQFTTAGGLNEVRLDYKDDFAVDNRIYMNLPKNEKLKVLLITNKDRSFLRDLLLASDDVSLEVSTPPFIPSINHDIVIVHEVGREQFIVAIANRLASFVDSGGKLVITSQEDSNLIDYRGILPVSLQEKTNGTYPVVKLAGELTSDITFDKITGYFKASKKPNAVDILADGGGSSLITIEQKGAAKVVYYGIIEKESDFKLSPSYPVFWHRLLSYISGVSSFTDSNKKTTDTLVLDTKKTVKTPSGDVVTDKLLLSDAGFYQINSNIIAVNLLNQNESQVNRAASIAPSLAESISKDKYKQIREMELVLYLLIAGICLAFLEIFYVKRRGDM